MRGLGPRRPLAVGWAALALSLASGCAEAPGSSISEDAAERGRQRASSAPAGASAGRRSTQERGFQIVQVLPRRSIVLRARPGGRALRRLRSRTEFGSRRFLGVAATDGPWLGVVSAERPNGRLGWIDGRSDALKTVWTDVSLRVDLSRRVLEVRDGTRTTRRVLVGVGREGYPTPTGRFAVTDKLRNGFGPSYGCCIVALSGHQTRLPPGWPGGDRLAVHGTPSPGSIGKAASTGCLRAGERDMRSLLRTVPLGAPVFIER